MRIEGLGPITAGTGVKSVTGEAKTSFKEALFNEIEKVNASQQEAEAASNAVVVGDAESIHEAMIAGSKAQLTLEFAVAVNNKAIEAYKETMRLQL